MNTITFKLESRTVKAERKLKVTWTPDFAKELNDMRLYAIENGLSPIEPHKILTVKEWVRRKKVEAAWEEKTGLDALCLTEEYQKAYSKMMASRFK